VLLCCNKRLEVDASIHGACVGEPRHSAPLFTRVLYALLYVCIHNRYLARLELLDRQRLRDNQIKRALLAAQVGQVATHIARSTNFVDSTVLVTPAMQHVSSHQSDAEAHVLCASVLY
jgi:hypothetical protein